MFQFDSVEEWKKEFKNISILEWICPNNDFRCTKDTYNYLHAKTSPCNLKK